MAMKIQFVGGTGNISAIAAWESAGGSKSKWVS